MQCLLIAHPDATLRQEMDSMLRDQFSIFIEEENGKSALKAVVSTNPDVLILALNLPILNGLSLAKILTLLGLKIPVILLTDTAEVPAAVAKYSIIKKTIPLDLVYEQLEPAVAEISKNFTNEYYDLNFHLERDEVLALLSSRNKNKILVIEPDSKFQMEISRTLSDFGDFEFFYATSGQEGLLKSVMIKPNLIITEQELDEIDGVSMVQVLIVLGHSFPILFIAEGNLPYLQDQTRGIKEIKGIIGKGDLATEPILLTQVLQDVFATEKELETDLEN